MKKSYKTLLAAMMLAIGMPVVAENVDQATGTVDGEVPYTWSFWNDKKDTGELWPNWKVEFTPELDEAPANVAFNYVFKKGDAVVMSGAANGSGINTKQATSYTGPWADLEEGDYQMLTTVTIIKAGSTVPIISNFDCPVKVEAAPVAEYNFTFNHTEVVTANSITVNYEFVEDNGKTVPADAVYHLQLGMQPGGVDKVAETASGSILFENLNPNTNHTFYTNNPSVTIDGVKYIAKGGNFNVKTLEGDPAPSDKPTANLTYEIVNGPEKAYFNYSIAVENIDEANVESYRVWLDAPGNVLMGESTTKEGSIEISVAEGDQNLWFKGQVTYKDGEESKTINTNPNDQGVTFKKVSDPSVVLPVLDLTVGEPKATGLTTGEITFTITTDKPELENVTYHVWCNTTGDKVVGDMTTTDLTGTLLLTNLTAGGITELWVKAQAEIGADKSDAAQYPGEPQGWTGLSIDTSAFDDGTTPVMPQITLSAMDPLQTGDDTGTLRYEIVLSNETFFESLDIKCVTNAWKVNDGDVDVVLAEITGTKDLTGTLQLTGLKPNAVNGLWVKAVITLTDGQKSDEIMFPGAAQGYTGLEIDMRSDAISAVEAENDAPVEYFNLQGVRVENPVNGLFIRRQGTKVSKVVIR